jgi:murein peptide amidase A
MPLSRRQLLRILLGCGGAGLAGAGFFGQSTSVVQAAPGLRTLTTDTVGTSRESRPVTDFKLAGGSQSALIVGGIHAGTEANTVKLVQGMLAAAQADPAFLPPELNATFLPAANPDGLANGTRMVASGVDPNRNWPTDDWATDTYAAASVIVPGGGGPFPLSEPETQALAALVTRMRPSLIVSYHSAAGLVTGGPAARAMGLESTYARTVGYAAGDWTSYPVTGDFAQWAERKQGIATVEVELPDHYSTDFDANLAALRETLWKLTSTPPL